MSDLKFRLRFWECFVHTCHLPFSYKALPADLIVKEIGDGETFIIGDNTRVHAADLNHPGGCLGYRIENDGAVFAYCSDVSHYDDRFDPNVLKLAEGADVMVHDTHFPTMEERNKFSDWGHSCWEEAVQVAIEARVKCLALFHYAPDLTDDEADQILIKARRVFPNTILAKEGLELNLPLTSLPE